jgi:hypothetical protein
MRFIIGQAFECTVDGRQAAVDEIRDDRRAGHAAHADSPKIVEGQLEGVRQHR